LEIQSLVCKTSAGLFHLEISRLVCNSKEFGQKNFAFVVDFEGFLREDFAAGLELLQMRMMFAKDLNSNQLDLILISLRIQWVLINMAMD
jgi:hypothetical protein